MTGWQHTCLDYDPATDGDEEQWARAVAAEGWQTWHASGRWVTIGSRRVRRWALRRPCDRPWSVHDHAEKCLGDADRSSARTGGGGPEVGAGPAPGRSRAAEV